MNCPACWQTQEDKHASSPGWPNGVKRKSKKCPGIIWVTCAAWNKESRCSSKSSCRTTLNSSIFARTKFSSEWGYLQIKKTCQTIRNDKHANLFFEGPLSHESSQVMLIIIVRIVIAIALTSSPCIIYCCHWCSCQYYPPIHQLQLLLSIVVDINDLLMLFSYVHRCGCYSSTTATPHPYIFFTLPMLSIQYHQCLCMVIILT